MQPHISRHTSAIAPQAYADADADRTSSRPAKARVLSCRPEFPQSRVSFAPFSHFFTYYKECCFHRLKMSSKVGFYPLRPSLATNDTDCSFGTRQQISYQSERSAFQHKAARLVMCVAMNQYTLLLNHPQPCTIPETSNSTTFTYRPDVLRWCSVVFSVLPHPASIR